MIADSELIIRDAKVTKVGFGIDLLLRALYQVQIRGREHFTRSPSTIIVSNHRRDSDGPIIASALVNRCGFDFKGVQPFIVAREDLFRKGFLWEYLTTWPPWMREFLSPINLQKVMHRLQVYPMRRIPERNLGETLADVADFLGDLPLAQVLKPRWVEQFKSLSPPTCRPTLSVKQVLARRFRRLLSVRRGLFKLTLPCFLALKPYERQMIDDQLKHFTDILESGRILQFEPEGTTSPNGSFQRFRGGLHLLLSRTRAPVRVLPIGLTYDFMTTGRQTIFLNMGPELTDLQALSRKQVDQKVSTAILNEHTITTSHLASQFLATVRRRGHFFTFAELLDHVGRAAERCVADGIYVDPRLLVNSQLTRRVRRYLQFALHTGMIAGRGRLFYSTGQDGQPAQAGLTDPEATITYITNELESFSMGGAPA